MPEINDSYLPIPWDFREVLEEVQKTNKEGIIYYFTTVPDMEKAEGTIVKVAEEKAGEYLFTSKGDKVRLDKVVTLYGRPGPSYDTYDSYANACLNTSKDNC